MITFAGRQIPQDQEEALRAMFLDKKLTSKQKQTLERYAMEEGYDLDNNENWSNLKQHD